MLEDGSVCWHPEQEEFISHFFSAADEVSVEWMQYCLTQDTITRNNRNKDMVFSFNIYSDNAYFMDVVFLFTSSFNFAKPEFPNYSYIE